ncbi:MAG: periplasmic binding protein/LacI transcriptional regulator [Verrucomicrobiales bacterium]|nr:periplasmic binding protein/LacI transcriptional regulator [Verrucomicrobiales bacterium]
MQRRSSAITIKEVAAAAKVSTATVSRAFAGMDCVNPQLRQHVLGVASSLNYQPNRVARSLRSRTSNTIGLLIPDIDNHFFTGAVRGIESVLNAADYTMLLGHSNDDPKRERNYLSTLRAEGVAGIIFCPNKANHNYYLELQRDGLPMVCIAREISGFEVDTVTVANKQGGYMATKHLLALGHNRIAIITGPQEVSNARERLEGYRQALQEAGIPEIPFYIQQADYRQQQAYLATLKLLDHPAPPTAIFVTNEVMTLGTLEALKERQVKIPSEMALVGFDDPAWMKILSPGITVVKHPSNRLGAQAAELLLQNLKKPKTGFRQFVMETELIIRGSCGVISS